MLNLTGERKPEPEYQGAKSYLSERDFGRFYQQIVLPTPAEPGKIEAHYKDGMLTAICPKAEEAKRKEIKVE